MKTRLVELSTTASLLFVTLLASTCYNPVFGTKYEYFTIGGSCISEYNGATKFCQDYDHLIQERLDHCINTTLSHYDDFADGVLNDGKEIPDGDIHRNSPTKPSYYGNGNRYRGLMNDNNAMTDAEEETAPRSLITCQETRCFKRCYRRRKRNEAYCITSCAVKGVTACGGRRLSPDDVEDASEQEQGSRHLDVRNCELCILAVELLKTTHRDIIYFFFFCFLLSLRTILSGG